MLVTCIWVMKRSLGKRWQVFFFEFSSCWRMDFYLNHWHTDRSWLKERYVWKTFSSASQVEREVMEMVSRCFSSGGLKKTICQLPWPSPLTEKISRKSSEIGEGNHQLSNPRRIFGHEEPGGLVGLVGLVDRHKRLGSTPPHRNTQDAGCNHGKFWRLFCRKFPSLKMGNVILIGDCYCMFHMHVSGR